MSITLRARERGSCLRGEVKQGYGALSNKLNNCKIILKVSMNEDKGGCAGLYTKGKLIHPNHM